MTVRTLALAAAAALSLTSVSPARAMDMAQMENAMMMISGLLFSQLAAAGIDTSRMASVTLSEAATIIQLLGEDDNRPANLAQIEKILSE